MGQSSTKAGVVVWGSLEHGQLGIGSLSVEDRALPPKLVEGLRSVHVRHIACSGHYSAALSESGEVYTWGGGKDGQLGHGDGKDVYVPKAVRALQSKLIRNVSCAEHHIAAVSESGVLYTWGRGQNGRLGHGGTENELLPKVVDALVGQHVVQVSCGDFHTACVILSPTHVYTWGLGLSGRLGHRDEKDCLLPTPVEALAGVHIACINCGGHHSAVITDPAGQLMTWGGGAFGKLGHGNRLAQTSPKTVGALQNKKLVQVSLGPHHSAVLTQKGEVYTWGQAGRLGHASQGAEVDEMVPRQVMALSNVFVLQISCGHSHCAVVTETGDVWAWGSSRAFGHTEANAVPNVPTLIKVLSGKAIVQVACAMTHSIALSDYRRLTGKAAMATARSMGAGASSIKDKASSTGGVSGGRRGDPMDDPAGESKKPEEASSLSHLRSGPHGGGIDERNGPHGGLLLGNDRSNDCVEGLGAGPEWKGQPGNKPGLPSPTTDREVAFLSNELKAYQEQTLRLAKLLQEAKVKLETLQNENSFLKSELEVMHQCSNDADERLDTLRRHFNERIREMERRYDEKERSWKNIFQNLRSHLDLSAVNPENRVKSLGGLSGYGGLGGLSGLGGLGGLGHDQIGQNRGDALQSPALGFDPTVVSENGPIGLPGEEASVGAGVGEASTGVDTRSLDAGRAGGRSRATGLGHVMWPSGQS